MRQKPTQPQSGSFQGTKREQKTLLHILMHTFTSNYCITATFTQVTVLITSKMNAQNKQKVTSGCNVSVSVRFSVHHHTERRQS